jgi:hypothetical protein
MKTKVILLLVFSILTTALIQAQQPRSMRLVILSAGPLDQKLASELQKTDLAGAAEHLE